VTPDGVELKSDSKPVAIRRKGGFRTRANVALVRDWYHAIHSHLHDALDWFVFVDHFRSAQSFNVEQDRRRVCPHHPSWWVHRTEGWIDCDACGLCLKTPKGSWRL
jgi:hypothetical protein